ncbi:MAG: RNA polymerase sigma factor [Actinomycetota bacterium]|nr:RNA polymerase sigma factor [Actinomycetota bacterium]
MPSEDFHQILAAARTGAEWAWTSIYRELAPPVLGYLRGRGADEPEDLTGEVFLQVVRDLPRFEGDERDFRAWVFVIAHHRLLDDVRRRSRRPAEAEAELPDQDDPCGDAEAGALRSVAEERVRMIIGQLPAGQRDVLLLRIVGDLTIEEVARALDKSAGAVKALQRRGLAEIQRALAKEGVTL